MIQGENLMDVYARHHIERFQSVFDVKVEWGEGGDAQTETGCNEETWRWLNTVCLKQFRRMGRSMSRRRNLLAVAAVLLLAYFYVSAHRYVRAPTAEEAARARKLYLPGAEPVIGHPSAPLGASASSHPDACAGDACVTCTICTLVDEDGEWKSGDEYCSTKGDFTIVMKRAWAPLGYDRFLELVRANFFDNQIIYRVLPGFLVQFGVAADPSVQAKWSSSTITDDPQQNIPFTAGTVSFAGSGQDSRSSHIFIALDPAGKALGTALHERPFGRIHAPRQQKMVASLYSGYGDLTDLQSELTTRGNAAAGTQITCFTSTNSQILTPEALRLQTNTHFSTACT
jgi:peptidyl-prolyl cis-trans isomerase A (cyclophilin A)